MSYLGSGTQPVAYADTTQVDSFGRLRTSDSNVLLDSQLDFDLQPLLWQNVLTGGGSVTHDEPDATAVLAVTAAAGDEVIRQTRRYWKYRAGQSLRITMTSVFGAPVAGVIREQGFFDDDNGIFLRQNASGGIELVVRSNVTGTPAETVIPQGSWNKDPLNGAGPSELTLDITKAQIFWIDLQWLGVGRVPGGFNINGVDVEIHEFLHSNIIDTVYMSTGTLPVRYRIFNDTGANPAEFRAICSSVFWEGGSEGPGYLTSADTGITPYSATVALTSLVAIRLNSTHIRATLRALSFEVVNAGVNDVRAVLLHFTPDNVPAGLTWSAGSGDASEISTDNVAVTEANGYRIQTEYVLNSTGKKASVQVAEVDSYLRVAADYAGASDVIVLAVQTVTNTSDCYGTISYKELY